MARRLRIYFFGFILGIVFVIFLYGDKTDIIVGWIPEKRVLKRIKLTEKIISDSMQCILDCNKFNDENWETLYKNGDVDFSEARQKPYPIYSVSVANDENSIYNLRFVAKDSLTFLVAFESTAPVICECD